MREIVVEVVTAGLHRLTGSGELPAGVLAALPEIKVERPREKTHGDFSTNAALVLARHARMKPLDLARKILAAIPTGQTAGISCDIAGPGFINFHIAPERLRLLLGEILERGARYGHSEAGRGQKVLVEFVSANPTGPMHVGHGRGAVTGDTIARLLAATGHQVTREYYINDAGAQVEVLGRSVLHRCREIAGHVEAPPEGGYPGEYVIEIARALLDRHGDPATLPFSQVVDFAIDWVIREIREDLETMQIHFDQWFSERSLHVSGGIDRAVEELSKNGWIVQGVLERPKGWDGASPEDYDSRPQLLFRSSHFGDDSDRPLQKGDGSYTYFAADIAYHFDKARRGFERLVDVWGADHGGYVKRVQAALEALTGRRDILDVILTQMVNLTQGGKPVRMSKRAGTFVTLRDVVKETGVDAVRFWFLTRSSGAGIDFDLDLAKSRTNDNPVFYVQYAHARVFSLQGKLQERNLACDQGDRSRLDAPEELDLIRRLGLFPETVEGAALSREPHRLTYYLSELAAAFHGYYNNYRILDEDPGLRGARMELCLAVRQVIANGLDLLGVSAPESM
ncbi:MAG: arginine--tRNA ligase [Magnetococcales bacterium]|nr:arginine--tRNA ligase [Magnetococcales bacterium]